MDMPYKIPDNLNKKKMEKKENDKQVDKKENDKQAPVPVTPKVYTQEEVDSIIQKRGGSDGSSSGGSSDEDEFGLSPKLLKGLQSTVGVFNALKEFASSPLTRLIETRVGERAATIVDNAFGAPQHGGGDKKDLLDMFLNSQMAFGFGQGLGARGPEFVESLGRTIGKEKVDKFTDNMLNQYEKARGDRSGGVGGSGGIGGGPIANGAGPKDTSKRDLLLSLDPNNPEHVAAYADSQDGISLELARKMLRAHQDDFIKQMETQGTQGLDVTGFRNKSGDENSEIIRLKQEQEEMLRVKREVDKQLAQLDDDKTGNKVVSFKDIKGKGNLEEIVEEVAEIPDKWGNEDLSEAERESVANAERERLLANIGRQQSAPAESRTGTIKENTEEIKENTEEIKVVETIVDNPIIDNPVVDAPVIETIVAPEEDEVLDLSKVVPKSKFQRGSQGWLREQKEKKIAKERDGRRDGREE